VEEKMHAFHPLKTWKLELLVSNAT
jgi:hypothetical protein